MRPLATVLVLAYGRREYVGQALRSALEQSAEEPYEVVVVSDFWLEPPEGVRAVRSSGGLGYMALAGLRASSGDVLLFLDDDDLFLPGKLRAVLDRFSDPSLGYYHNDFIPIAEDGVEELPGELAWLRELARMRGSLRFSGDLPEGEDPYLVHSNSFFNSSCISIRRSAISGEFLRAMAEVELSLDNFLFSAALASGMDVLVDGEVLTKYRLHQSNRSADGNYSGPRVLRDAERILRALGGYAPRLASILRGAVESSDPAPLLRGLVSRNFK